MPVLRSGGWADIGSRSNMEDVYVCLDDFFHNYGLSDGNRPNAFYGVHSSFTSHVFLIKSVSKLYFFSHTI